MERPNSKGSQNFLVGMFLAVALLVGAGFVVFMGKSVVGQEHQIRARFNDVRGLNIGAPVFLSGIQVGRIAEMEFPSVKPEDTDVEDKNKIIVIISLFAEHAERVREDSEVTISTQGMLGDKVVVITPGEGKPAAENQMLQSRQPKELNDYFAKGGSLVETLQEAAVNVNVLLKTMNETGKVTSILENMDRTFRELSILSKSLNQGEGTLGALIRGGEKDSLGNSLKSLERVMTKIDRGQGTLGALINDPSLHEDLRILLGGAQRSTAVRFLLRQAISAGDKKTQEKEQKK